MVLRFIVKPNLSLEACDYNLLTTGKAHKLLISREITHATNFIATQPEAAKTLYHTRADHKK